MALSPDTIKNLLDLMQKLSLAIVVVSIGLFSNVVLSHSSIERKAGDELDQVLRIRDQFANDSAVDVVHRELPSEVAYLREPAHENSFTSLHLTLKTGRDPTFSKVVQLLIPAVVFNTAFTDLDRKSFSQIQTLEEMRKVWDTIYSTTSFSNNPKITGIVLDLLSTGKIYPLQWEEEEVDWDPLWPLSPDTQERQFPSDFTFKIGPAMEQTDLNSLAQALKLPVVDLNLLANDARLIVQTSWTKNKFLSCGFFWSRVGEKAQLRRGFSKSRPTA